MRQFTSGFPTKYLCRKLRGKKKSLFSELFWFEMQKKKKKAYLSFTNLAASFAQTCLLRAFLSPLLVGSAQTCPIPSLHTAQAQAENPRKYFRGGIFKCLTPQSMSVIICIKFPYHS